MKPSQNMYTETILWTLGEQAKVLRTRMRFRRRKQIRFSIQSDQRGKGVFVIGNFLREIGVAADSVIQWDGSGLSRHNLVTPASLVQLYTFMAKQSRNAQRGATVCDCGVDGHIAKPFQKPPADETSRQTGTIDQFPGFPVMSTTAAGETVVFPLSSQRQ
jgi:D-alanyl-D-alanine carboxypeptidase